MHRALCSLAVHAVESPGNFDVGAMMRLRTDKTVGQGCWLQRSVPSRALVRGGCDVVVGFLDAAGQVLPSTQAEEGSSSNVARMPNAFRPVGHTLELGLLTNYYY